MGIEPLIDRLPEGIETQCYESGVALSSGERQLIALARAFLAEPRVLVLDEATSNLDLQTEGMVEHALDVLLGGRTAVLVAHRLSTAMRADRIAVIHQGRVVELGSHDELVAQGGRYASMFDTWSRQGGRRKLLVRYRAEHEGSRPHELLLPTRSRLATMRLRWVRRW